MRSLSRSGVAVQAELGPRVRRLHRRIARAHRRAEGMALSRQMLAGEASPRQIAGLMRALSPAYRLLETLTPSIAKAFNSSAIPWTDLSRAAAFNHDLSTFSCSLQTPPSAASQEWQRQIRLLIAENPHRLLAHVYIRYGGDLSGGQALGRQVNHTLQLAGYRSLIFWEFPRSVSLLKEQFHQGFEQLQLTEQQDMDLLDETENAFHLTQSLLSELADLTPASA